METLKLIASHDDIIEFTEGDLKLAKKFIEKFPGRTSTFEPLKSACSNFEWTQTLNVWSDKESLTKRGIGKFNEELYTKNYIKARLAWLSSEDKESKKEPLGSGFDWFAYYMDNQEDVNDLYSSDKEISEKACLHCLETNTKPSESMSDLSFARYVASYDDVIKAAVNNRPQSKEWSEWITEAGKLHYDSKGKREISSGKRKIDSLFSVDNYVASYTDAIDHLKNDNDEIDHIKVCVTYITFGSAMKLKRDSFEPWKVLAHVPKLYELDIYTKGAVDIKKVTKKWVELAKTKTAEILPINIDEYCQLNEIKDKIEGYKSYSLKKIGEFKEEMKKKNSIFYKLKLLLTPRMPSCLKPKPKA